MKKILRGIIVFFFASTILAVIAFRFVPVLVTPLMVIRLCEQVKDGVTPRIYHRWTSLENISPHMPVAVMASEDQRFLLHHGFDYKAIENAAKKNRKSGTKKLGASTITQQTAKNVFLWPGRTWLRKGLEAYFSLLIEIFWSKQRIMEVYLNSIEMGDQIYGIYSVSKHHFDKKPIDLTRSECALIAATLPNPHKYSSKQPTPYVKKRQRQIEKQMINIPSFPKEGEKVNPNTVRGGIYKKK